MIPGSREKRGVDAPVRAGRAAPEVTLVAAPRRRAGRASSQLYLERDSLVEMTERPLLVMSRPSPGEQTQIVRRPVRKPAGRRWIFIFGGAATATLLAAWLGLAHQGRTAQPAAMTVKDAPAALAPARENVAARPIVAPLAAQLPSFAAISPVPAVAARRAARPAGPASGRHTKTAPARIASASRLAAHRATARPARPTTTVAWVDPFIDR